VPGYGPDRPLGDGGHWMEGTSAFVHPFGQAAHGVCYKPVYIDGVAVRLTKPAVRQGIIPADQVRCSWVAVDVDLPNKESWTQEVLHEHWGRLQKLPYPFNQWLYWHTTEHGYHLWYLLDEEVSHDQHEKLSQALRDGLVANGVEADETCRDWTRLVALPRIVKENGIDTAQQPWFVDHWQSSDTGQALTLQVASLSIASAAPTKGPAMPVLTGPGPEFTRTPDEALTLVYTHGDLDYPTEEGRILRKAVESSLMRAGNHTIAAEQVLDGQPFPQGMRDTSVAQTVGWLVSKARSVSAKGITPDHLLGLLVPACNATDIDSGPQDNGRPWIEKAAEKTLEYWRSDEESVARKQVEMIRKAQNSTTPEGLCDLLHSKLKDPLLNRNTNEAWYEQLQTYAFLQTSATSVFCLAPNGCYQGPFPSFLMAIGMSARNGVGVLLGVRWLDDSGSTKEISEATAKKDYCRFAAIDRQLYHPLSVPEEDRFEPVRLDQQQVCLFERKFRPQEVQAQRSEWVEKYLHVLTGSSPEHQTEDYKQLTYWLAYLRDFDNSQLPMLYIYGTARSGKTLLGNAIEMQAATARPSTAGGNYNSHYAKGLILIYDDVQPISYGNHGQMKRALGEFLNVLSGQQVEVHEKYKDARGLQYPWRVVVLNNSSAFFDDLMNSHNSYSDRDKRDALAQRSILIKVNAYCREWLFENARDRADVVAEVAAHIAWMNQNREELRPIFEDYERLAEPGGMRLVSNSMAMGTAESSQSLDEIQMIGAVVKQLSKCLKSSMINDNYAVLDKTGEILAVRGALMEALGAKEATAAQRFHMKQAIDAIMNARGRGPTTATAMQFVEGQWVPSPSKSGKRRWVSLDFRALSHFCEFLPPGVDHTVQELMEQCQEVKELGL
jgi:hypothetical protein